MAYSRSVTTIEARLHVLEPLIRGEPCRWACKPEEERGVARKIREALWIAANVAPSEYPELAQAHKEFEIISTNGSGVIARYKLRTTVMPISEEYSPAPPAPTPPSNTEEKIRPTRPELQTLDVTPETLTRTPITKTGTLTLTQIIDLIQRHGVAGCPYHFPDAMLPTGEVLNLYNWLESKDVYLLFWAHPSITIKEYDDELEPFSFTPEDII